MYTPILLPRGYSVDEYHWTEWFKLRHKEFGLDVFTGRAPDGNTWIKVENTIYNIPIVRAVVAILNTEYTSVAPFTFEQIEAVKPMFEEWLTAGFKLEVELNLASWLSSARTTGVNFLTPEELDDASKYYMQMSEAVNVAKSHVHHNQAVSVAPKSYSALTNALKDLDFDTEIDTDE